MSELNTPLTQHLKRLKRKGIRRVALSTSNLDLLKEKKTEPVAKIEKTQPVKPVSKPQNKNEKTAYGKPIPAPPEVTLQGETKEEQYTHLRERILNCPVCNEHVRTGKKVVVGSGNLDSKIFFCGEAPGADEEIQGEVFVGKAGQLLTKIIQAMGLQRSDVYIGNIMNWRPEMPTQVGNRAPTQEEMAFCLPYLKAQLQIVQPEVIVALGATAVNGLLGPDPKRRMGSARGNWFEFEKIPLMITFHPSYLLRNNTNKTKRMVWEDMLKVMERTKMSISEKQKHYFLA